MADYVPIKIFQGALNSSPTTLYTAPALTRVLVTSVVIANTNTTTSRAVTLKGGATPSTWLPGVPVAASTTLPFAPHQILEAGETVNGSQDAGTDVHVCISGVAI